MKKILLVLLCATAWALPARATITEVQHQNSGTACGTATTCAVTITSVGAGHLLVVQGYIDSTINGSISSVACTSSTCGTWVINTACKGNDSTAGSTTCAYVLSSSAGAVTCTVTFAASNSHEVDFREFSFTGSAMSLDVAGARDQSSSVSSMAGVALTLTGTNDVIVQFGVTSGNFSTISSPYGNVDLPNGNGSASSLNTTSGTAPTWTMSTAGFAALAAIAFKETGGGGGATHHQLTTAGAGD